MNSSPIKNSSKDRRKVAVTLSLSLLVSLSLRPAIAQLRSPKRITSVWTATTADGSRVHVLADSPVNDYEAYTRGNRFYVKIPAADLPSTTGSLLGRGFDDVQIQRAGNGIIISFRLQPGSTARVEQKVNRLEIVFSIPMRSQSAGSVTKRNEFANRTRDRGIQDTSGPTPPRTIGENSKTRKPTTRYAAERHASVATLRRGNKPKHARETVRSNESTAVGNTGSVSETGRKGPTGNENAASASPLPSASSVSSPASITSATLLASASPYGTSIPAASPTSQQATSSASPNSVSSNGQQSVWSSRLHYYKVWAKLNWLPLLIGGLVFLALLVFLFVGRRSKDKGRETAGREEKPVEKTTAAAAGAEAARPANATPRPASTAPANAAADHKAEVPSKNTRSSSAAGVNAPADEDHEREVFEL